MADQNPFAAAGFAPAANQPPPAADPFAAAGFAPTPQAPQPAPMSAPIGVDEYGSPIFGNDQENAAVREGEARVGEKALQGATFGVAPYIEAGVKWLGGTPFQEGLKQARDYSAETSKQSPVAATIAEGTGSLIPTMLGYGAAAPIINWAGRAIPYVGSALANAILGGGLGAASSAGHDVGAGTTENLGSDTAKGAAVGGVIGGLSPIVGATLQTAPNMVRGGIAAGRNVFTNQGRDAVAGQVLREASGDFANTAARSPIPGLELRTAQATGNPGVAALERTLASEPGPQAANAGNLVQNGRTPNQTTALAQSLVGSDAGIEPVVLANQASARGTQAIQGAAAALKEHENSLWTAPELNDVKIKTPWLVQGVNRSVSSMAPSFRNTIQNGALSGHLDDLAAMPQSASLADINAIRSRILEDARAARASGDNVTARAADNLAGSILDRTNKAMEGVGSNIQEAYSAAREFTHQRAIALGHPEFDAVLRPNAAGNMRANDETTFGRFFDTSGGTDTGLGKLQQVHDLLAGTGASAPAKELSDSTRQYLNAAILKQARAGNGLDATGQPAMNVATLASTVNKSMPAISGTPMTAPIAGDVQAAGNAAELLNRPSTLRGDTNSTTFEKLRNRDLVSAILGQAGSSSLGAAAGGYAAGEYGPESVPPWLRIPGGMLAGAMMGQRVGPYIGKVVGHIPGASAAITGPTEDIMRRVASGLATPAEYQRLMAAQMLTGPDLLTPGMLSTSAPIATRAAIPLATSGGAR